MMLLISKGMSMQRNRDDFSKPIKDLLAKRAGYRCSNPECRHITIGANSNPQKSINIGVASHISAASKGGPRYNPNINSQERASIENAIWLCQTCSVLIDKDPNKYTVDILHKWKISAEQLSMDSINTTGIIDCYISNEPDQWSEDFETEFENMEKYSTVICDITSLLAACRNSMSWDNRSELKLYSWLNNHSEEEIYEEDISELESIRNNIIEYLKIHLKMDDDLMNVPFDDYTNEEMIYQYIKVHPALTAQELAQANRINVACLKTVLDKMWKVGRITHLSLKDNAVFDEYRWIKDYDFID